MSGEDVVSYHLYLRPVQIGNNKRSSVISVLIFVLKLKIKPTLEIMKKTCEK